MEAGGRNGAARWNGFHMRHLNRSYGVSGAESADVARILEECAARRAMALVLDLETEWLSRAEFVACSGASLALEVFNVTPDCFPAASLASVAFVWGEQTRMFLAPVLGMDARPAPDPSRLELEPPLEIASAMGMIRYRVPVYRDSGLEVKVIPEDNPRLVRAQAVNLSLTGVLVEFTEASDPHLPVGARLTLAFSLGRQGASLAGEVVRTRHHQYGIRFLDAAGAAVVDAPEELRMIVRVLERRWLRERVRPAAGDAEEQARARGIANVPIEKVKGQTL